MKHFLDAIFEDLNLNEGIWGYQTWTRTGSRNKPIYTLTYGEILLLNMTKTLLNLSSAQTGKGISIN